MSQRIKAVNLRGGGYVTAQGHDNHALWEFCGAINVVYDAIMKAADLNTEYWQEELVDSGTFFQSRTCRVNREEWGKLWLA